MIHSASVILLVFFLGIYASDGFRWHIKELVQENRRFTFSERFMFADANGPLLLEQGQSYIDVEVNITALVNLKISLTAALAIYATDEATRHYSLVGLCEEGGKIQDANTWAKNIETNIIYIDQYDGEVQVPDSNGVKFLYHQQSGLATAHYVVRNELWHNVVFLLCEADVPEEATVAVSSSAVLDGLVTFRNPYGFIPGEMYGMLPFEGARMVAYVLFSCFFVYHYYQNRESLQPLHKALLLVFLFALAEATMWYAAYQVINLTGEPYCCPFPPTVVASLVLQIFRQTFARTVLLVVCLGYGIVRPKLMTAEWTAISIISFLYLVAAIIAQVSDIILVQDGVGDPEESSAVYFKVPELFMDVIFLTWIYLAIHSTIRILTEFQQTVKLKMYQQLVFIVGLFAILFAAATVIFVLDDAEVISWPWQFAWVQKVMWETLNFAVLAAVCFICKPTENSRLLSYASQLPTEDPDEEDDDVEGDIGMVVRGDNRNRGQEISFSENDDDDYFERKIGGSFAHEINSGRIGSGGFAALPEAEDEDYGLDD